jgi:hypothetical protein
VFDGRVQLVFAVSSVVVAQHLIEELHHYEKVLAKASYKDGQILLEIECPPEETIIWEIRGAVTIFDEAAVEVLKDI